MEDKTQETKEEAKPEEKPEVQSEGLIDKANEAAERMEAANKKQEELLNRQEKMSVEAKLSGRSEAGIQAEPPKEETPQEYKDRVMKGEVDN